MSRVNYSRVIILNLIIIHVDNKLNRIQIRINYFLHHRYTIRIISFSHVDNYNNHLNFGHLYFIIKVNSLDRHSNGLDTGRWNRFRIIGIGSTRNISHKVALVVILLAFYA